MLSFPGGQFGFSKMLYPATDICQIYPEIKAYNIIKRIAWQNY